MMSRVIYTLSAYKWVYIECLSYSPKTCHDVRSGTRGLPTCLCVAVTKEAEQLQQEFLLDDDSEAPRCHHEMLRRKHCVMTSVLQHLLSLNSHSVYKHLWTCLLCRLLANAYYMANKLTSLNLLASVSDCSHGSDSFGHTLEKHTNRAFLIGQDLVVAPCFNLFPSISCLMNKTLMESGMPEVLWSELGSQALPWRGRWERGCWGP